MNNEIIVIKLGGSVVTYKSENRKKIKKDSVKRLANEIASAQKTRKFRAVLAHGVGSYGHIIAKKFSLGKGFIRNSQITAISNLKSDLQMLNGTISDIFRAEGANVIVFHPSSMWEYDNGKIKDGNFNLISKGLDLGFLPILYGDLIFDKRKGFGIISADKIVVLLANRLGAKKIIVGTDVDGVFDCDPKKEREAKLVKEINKMNFSEIKIGGSAGNDVTGGMKGKIAELLKISGSNRECLVINATKPGVLKKALLGFDVRGTRIVK